MEGTNRIQTGDDGDVLIAMFVKGNERYSFMWTAGNPAPVLRMLGRFASNPELSLSWMDAATLTSSVREMERKTRSI